MLKKGQDNHDRPPFFRESVWGELVYGRKNVYCIGLAGAGDDIPALETLDNVGTYQLFDDHYEAYQTAKANYPDRRFRIHYRDVYHGIYWIIEGGWALPKPMAIWIDQMGNSEPHIHKLHKLASAKHHTRGAPYLLRPKSRIALTFCYGRSFLTQDQTRAFMTSHKRIKFMGCERRIQGSKAMCVQSFEVL